MQPSDGGLYKIYIIYTVIDIYNNIYHISPGSVRPPDGGPAWPPGGLLASDDLHLAHPHHLRPLRLHRQGGRAQVTQQLELQTINRFSQPRRGPY